MIISRSFYNKSAVLILEANLIAIIIAIAASNSLVSANAEKAEQVTPGDCSACHEKRNVLPANHVKIDKMKLPQCLDCHKKDAGKDKKPVGLRGNMPLSHLHQLSGVTCNDCHGITRPVKVVEIQKCLSCHLYYKEISTPTDKTLPHPHDSHMGDLNCAFCHHQHSRSENFCAQCHWWKYLVP